MSNIQVYQKRSERLFGQFNDSRVEVVIDQFGGSWFSALVIAEALQVSRSTVTHIKNKYEDQFKFGEEFVMMKIDGKRQLVFSEEGFLTICDFSTSPVAQRLRKWIRKQFRVKRDEAAGIVVYPKAQEQDDLSDIDPDFAAIRTMLDKAIQNRRRIRALEHARIVMEEEQKIFGDRVDEAEKKIQAFEDQSVIGPGEMTALQLARYVRWKTTNKGIHNLAVILAAVNENFEGRKFMRRVSQIGPTGRPVEEFVFNVDGVVKFKGEIDSQYCTGQGFSIEPNERAQKLGYKNKRNVEKH